MSAFCFGDLLRADTLSSVFVIQKIALNLVNFARLLAVMVFFFLFISFTYSIFWCFVRCRYGTIRPLDFARDKGLIVKCFQNGV